MIQINWKRNVNLHLLQVTVFRCEGSIFLQERSGKFSSQVDHYDEELPVSEAMQVMM